MLHETLGLLEPPSSGLGWHDAIVEGFKPSAIFALAAKLMVPPEAVCDLVGADKKLLAPASKNQRLTAAQSAHLHRVAVALNRLLVPLKNAGDCAKWLRNPQPVLKGRIPILLLTSHIGTEYVLTAISRMEPVGKVKMAPAAPDFTEHPGAEFDD